MAATEDARRPSTRPSASTTYQVRSISVTFGENVRTRPIFRIRVVGETASGLRRRGGLSAPGGPESRQTRIGPPAGWGKPPTRTAGPGSGGRAPVDHRHQAQAVR